MSTTVQKGSLSFKKRRSNAFVEPVSSVHGPLPWSSTFKEAVTGFLEYGFRTSSKTSSRVVNRYDGAGEEETRILAIATLPRLNHRSKTFRRRPSLKTFDSNSSLRSTGSIRGPDRFLPRRVTLNSATESFHISKDPRTLSPEEKLHRNKDASSDAFNPRRRVTSPIPRANRPTQRRHFSGNRSGSGGGSILTFQRDPTSSSGERQISVGTVWRVGGLAPVSGVPDGRGGLLGSGTNAPLYTTTFTIRPKAEENMDRHESRLAAALDIDRVSRVLECREPSPLKSATVGRDCEVAKTIWGGTQWIMGGPRQRSPKRFEIYQSLRSNKYTLFCPAPNSDEHTVLDAPNLRDDFYCSILAYCTNLHTLAVGLGSLLYAWSEAQGVHLLNNGTATGSWLTSLAFSSTLGAKCILAYGRSDGSLNLMSLYDGAVPRFEIQQPSPIACITWRPQTTLRPSKCPLLPGSLVKTEDLLVGDEIGTVYYYSVEWPEYWEVTRNGWSGSTTLLTKISVHTQQICGLSFSGDGSMFASGGNDNLCCLFQTSNIIRIAREEPDAGEEVVLGANGMRRVYTIADQTTVKIITAGAEKHQWIHGAAVKAIAFCPWREGLVATGGGSNDKCIHFYHTTSGTCLATISVAAQVTSLIWSNTRREIAATFGYAQPEHPFRIAVFSWPECKQVAAIPWEGEHRALYAIPYPGGPNESHTSREGGRGMTRTAQEGCIVVASSDESVKFHEVWTASQKTTAGGEGLLGGSDILEALEGIDKEGEIIR